MYDLLSKTIIRVFYGTNVEKTNRHFTGRVVFHKMELLMALRGGNVSIAFQKLYDFNLKSLMHCTVIFFSSSPCYFAYRSELSGSQDDMQDECYMGSDSLFFRSVCRQ